MMARKENYENFLESIKSSEKGTSLWKIKHNLAPVYERMIWMILGFKNVEIFNQKLQSQKEHFHKLMDLINTEEVFSMMGMSETTESYASFVHWKYQRDDSFKYETYLNDNCEYTKEFRLVIAVGGPCNGYKDFVKMLCLVSRKDKYIARECCLEEGIDYNWTDDEYFDDENSSEYDSSEDDELFEPLMKSINVLEIDSEDENDDSDSDEDDIENEDDDSDEDDIEIQNTEDDDSDDNEDDIEKDEEDNSDDYEDDDSDDLEDDDNEDDIETDDDDSDDFPLKTKLKKSYHRFHKIF